MEKKHTRSQRAEQRAADDAREFRAAVRDVKPLEQTPMAAGLAKPKPRVRLRRPPAAAEHLDEMMPLIAAGADAGVSNGDPATSAALSFQRAGVRTQVMRRLRRGLFPVEDELDLHGLNQATARDRLAEFIVRARDSGRRCVRIIHGKGYRSGARGPVLKTAVDLWLRRHLDVMAFSSARAIDGGTGALYVLLRA
ncbi:MAG TPA: Smr/MutS family protein [Steroidobacteraceae bacterium]|jgi:DNA-nicking Smr family endonuclease